MEIPFSNDNISAQDKPLKKETNRRLVIGIILFLCIIFISVGYKIYDLSLLQAHSTTLEQPAPDESEIKENDSSDQKTTLFVHVAGEVISPGLYELASGSRVDDAIKAAGGFNDAADRHVLNLASGLHDEQQIIVPSINNDQGDIESTSNDSEPTSKNVETANTQGSGRININTASLKELMSLSGIGEATAKKIIDDREKNGRFQSPSDLQRVQGIGAKRYESIKDYICI